MQVFHPNHKPRRIFGGGATPILSKGGYFVEIPGVRYVHPPEVMHRNGKRLVVRIRGSALSRRHGMKSEWIPTKFLILRMGKKEWLIEEEVETGRKWRDTLNAMMEKVDANDN